MADGGSARIRAVLEANVAVASEWRSDSTDPRNPDEAYSCYSGLTRHLDVARVLYNGEPIIEETLLTVEVKTRTKRGGVLFVPLAHQSQHGWSADPLEYAVADAINSLLWRVGFMAYMGAARVNHLVDSAVICARSCVHNRDFPSPRREGPRAPENAKREPAFGVAVGCSLVTGAQF